ncbi:uncharacterized protein LOC142575557 isoform X3 [Dermacentor variabilis]|uniref:uncharacterized protein LOC142575557 isoform X3 n=1 Tax=Dermacentor variabilis TaxID=34621 RepID=UPI003F5B755A
MSLKCYTSQINASLARLSHPEQASLPTSLRRPLEREAPPSTGFGCDGTEWRRGFRRTCCLKCPRHAPGIRVYHGDERAPAGYRGQNQLHQCSKPSTRTRHAAGIRVYHGDEWAPASYRGQNSIHAQNHEQGLAMHPGYEFTTETNGHLLATRDKINSINAQNHEQGLAMHPGYEFTTETNGHLLATRDKINSINAQNHEQGVLWTRAYLPPAKSALFVGTNAVRGIRIVAPVNVRGTTSTKGASAIASCSVV